MGKRGRNIVVVYKYINERRRGHVPTQRKKSPGQSLRAMAATSSAAAAAALASLPFPASASCSRVSASGHRGPRSIRGATIRCSSASPNLSQGAPAPAPPKPQIELEFLGVSVSPSVISTTQPDVCAGWPVESGPALIFIFVFGSGV